MYWHSRGVSYHEAGQYKHAIEDATKAIELEPDNADYWDSRAMSYHAAGQYDSAIADANSALMLNHRLTSAYYIRGKAYRRKNLLDQALQDLEMTVRMEPENDWYAYHLGVTLLKQEELEQAQTSLNNALKIVRERLLKSPKDWNAFFNLAIYLLAQGNHLDAERQYLEGVLQSNSIHEINLAVRFLQEWVDELADPHAETILLQVKLAFEERRKII